jgi:hypothetical protein
MKVITSVSTVLLSASFAWPKETLAGADRSVEIRRQVPQTPRLNQVRPWDLSRQ